VNHKLAQGGFLKSKLTFRFRDVVVLAMLAVGLRVAASAQNSGTVFLVRHAEKLSTARDAILSPQGHKRADCLAHTLGDAGIQAIFAMGLVRTQQTAKPLARKLGLKANTVEYKDTAGLVEKLRGMSDKTVLVVAHSDTLPEIMKNWGRARSTPLKKMSSTACLFSTTPVRPVERS
jgi:broad specificity phosphatase PhoE